MPPSDSELVPGEEESTAERQLAVNRLVVKNTFYLTASQVIAIPLAIVVNAVMARYLGAADFGSIYLAATVCSFGYLAVNWGHETVLPALIAQNRGSAARYLTGSIAWRLAMSVVVYVILALGCWLLNYSRDFQWVLLLTCIGGTMNSLLGTAKDTVRGFERADIPALAHVGQQFINALLVVVVLLAGGRTRAVLIAQALPFAIVLVFVWRALRSFEIGPLSLDRGAVKSLFVSGTPFVVLGLAMVLQPNIDAVYLSKLSSTEVIGWYAVSRRLIGILLFPVSALIAALYPTLCRLFAEDMPEFERVSRGAFQSVALLVGPVALGCALYPDIGIAIFSEKSFAPAEDNLRVLSIFLLFVFFTIALGTCIVAAGRQKIWNGVQTLCILVSFVLDPLLIPWFQKRNGNGGLGLCVASNVSELVVLVCGIALVPRGIFDRQFVKVMALGAFAGAVMAAAARLMHPFVTPYVAAPIAVAAYTATLWLTGAIDKASIDMALRFVRRRKARA